MAGHSGHARPIAQGTLSVADDLLRGAPRLPNWGLAALVEQRRGARNPHSNHIAPEVETKVLEHCLVFPTHGAQCVSNDLRLEKGSRENTTFILTDAQVRLLERHSPDFWHVESSPRGGLPP